MNFIELPLCEVNEKGVIRSLGKIYLKGDMVMVVRPLWDRDFNLVPDCCMIFLQNNIAFGVHRPASEVVELLTERSFT